MYVRCRRALTGPQLSSAKRRGPKLFFYCVNEPLTFWLSWQSWSMIPNQLLNLGNLLKLRPLWYLCQRRDLDEKVRFESVWAKSHHHHHDTALECLLRCIHSDKNVATIVSLSYLLMTVIMWWCDVRNENARCKFTFFCETQRDMITGCWEPLNKIPLPQLQQHRMPGRDGQILFTWGCVYIHFYQISAQGF